MMLANLKTLFLGVYKHLRRKKTQPKDSRVMELPDLSWLQDLPFLSVEALTFSEEQIILLHEHLIHSKDNTSVNYQHWSDINTHWLVHLADNLNEEYVIYQSDVQLLLYPANEQPPTLLLKYLESCHYRILRSLKGIARQPQQGKLPILIFADNEDYFAYIEQHFPDNQEYGLSSGLFFNGVIPQINLPHKELFELEAVILHEMTHAYLSHLAIPSWLNEGIAVNIEDSFCHTNPLNFNQQIQVKHLNHWNQQSIQEFWSGASFFASDEACQLSYQLAQLMVRSMSSDYERFVDFTNRAQYQDSGEQAAIDCLGGSLGEYLNGLLGDGPWRPAHSKS